jgi:electron transport complex protein RnfG
MDVEAPDGYAGPIRMLVAVDSQGRVLGVRVLTHSETRGLGDAIEARRSDWITRFSGRSLENPVPAGWALRREGGEFDQFAGATVTPRAVVSAVKRSLQFAAAHGREVWAADTGATLVFTTLPDPGASP